LNTYMSSQITIWSTVMHMWFNFFHIS
jgi:hypothetical protein